ncbi:VOC family protein [Geodermatophilus sp. SYSU D00815]
MSLVIHYAFLPHTDPEASLAFYRDVLGFEVRQDVGYGDMRWLPSGRPTSPTPRSCCTRRRPTPPSPTTSAARSSS